MYDDNWFVHLDRTKKQKKNNKFVEIEFVHNDIIKKGDLVIFKRYFGFFVGKIKRKLRKESIIFYDVENVYDPRNGKKYDNIIIQKAKVKKLSLD